MKLAIFVVSVLNCCTAAPAFAQHMPCGPAEQGLKIAAEKYHEHVTWTGKDGQGSRLILTTSPEGTWTLFAVPDGQDAGKPPIMCVIDSDGASQANGT